MKQVDKAHYEFSHYGFEERFSSYYWQLSDTLALNPSSVLEVGVGDKVFGNFLKSNTDVSYQSLDVAEDLKPDVVGSILALPFADKSFDVACAFEVLEHLPFENFDKAVSELARVARTHVIISVPHFGPMISFSLKIPFIPRIRFAFKLPFPRKHVFNGQHYWEIGKQGFPVSKIRAALGKYGSIVSDYIPFNSPYHHFFTIKK